MEEKKIKKALVFLVVSSGFLFFFALVSGAISLLNPSGFYIFGLSFPMDFFLFGLFAIFTTIIVYLFFPRIRRARGL